MDENIPLQNYLERPCVLEFLESVQKWLHKTGPRFGKNHVGQNFKMHSTDPKLIFSTKTFSSDVDSSPGIGFWKNLEKMNFSQFPPL